MNSVEVFLTQPRFPGSLRRCSLLVSGALSQVIDGSTALVSVASGDQRADAAGDRYGGRSFGRRGAEHAGAAGSTFAPTTAALQALAQRQRLTLNTLLLGAWALLLSALIQRHEVLRTSFPIDGDNTVASARQLHTLLEEDETTALLHELPGVYHTQIDELLLTALALA